MHFTSAKSSPLDSVVVKTQNCLARMEGKHYLMQCIITENNQIELTHYDYTKKRTHDSQIVRAKGNHKLGYGGPSGGPANDKHQVPTKVMKYSKNTNEI